MSEPSYKSVSRLARIVDSIAHRKTALRPRTKWELIASSETDAFKLSLCQICQKVHAHGQTVHTTSAALATTSKEGCLMCRILELAVKAYATNLRKQGSGDEHRIRLKEFDRDHKVEIARSRGSHSSLEIRVDIGKKWMDFSDRAYHQIEVYTLTGRSHCPMSNIKIVPLLLIHLSRH